ncbi:MAG: type I restriction enzyme HsdR N-terminal domain-containing protein, partial [Calditrichaeota bacterium]|nr:type I restriction enzyme HsdR N-terminal domain-containing protein [Calditrichota bacterium]
WVRQNFVQYLVQVLDYPRGLMQIEASITVYNFSRRCDAVLFDRSLQPRMIIECKAPDVTLNERTFEQIAVYNAALKARYLTVTNGRTHYCCRIDYDNQTYKFLPAIPQYNDLEI